MKQCPACRTTYTDVSLVYCLADGSKLIGLTSAPEEETVVLGRASPMRVDVPIEMPATSSRTGTSGARSNAFLKILVALLLVGLLVAAAVAVAMFVYFNQARSDSATNDGKASPSPSKPSPTPDKTEELRVMIANLERQIEEQKRKNLPINVPSNVPNDLDTTKTARVDSPGDGFLALRTLPNSEFGDRILKIPHGATVSVGACGPVMRPVSRSGRWCQARYNGRLGWVFDGYLIYE